MVIVQIIIIIGIVLSVLGLYKLGIEYQQRKIIRMSFKETMDICNLPIVTFINTNNKLNFLLDTGAQRSAINSAILPSIIYTESSKVGEIYGMDGTKHKISFVNIDIKRDSFVYTEEFQVVDLTNSFANIKNDYGVNLHGILSSTFFEKYKYILDFDKLIAYSKNDIFSN
ncbi:MAG: hypothetical protein ACI398_04095 [Clostridium sp.]